MGHAVVGGRKNFESMKRPLKGRRNFILTRNQDYKNDECEVIYSAEELLKRIDQSKEEIFIIGGEEVYRVFMPYSNKLYITIIEEDFEGDTYFPAISDQDWVLISEEKGITDEKNPYVNFYRVYERRVT
ncbi:Dihydrofolate reductase [compost metagenome]